MAQEPCVMNSCCHLEVFPLVKGVFGGLTVFLATAMYVMKKKHLNF